jgi:hypothetical protein
MKDILCGNSDRFLYERLRIMQADTIEMSIRMLAKNTRCQPRRTIILLPILEQQQIDAHISLAVKVLQAITRGSILILAIPYELMHHLGEEHMNQLNVGLPDHDLGHMGLGSLHLTKMSDDCPIEAYTLDATDKPNICFVLAHLRN